MIFLVLFAIFVATVLLAIVLERVLHSPGLVAITIFAIYLLILTILFAVGVISDFAIGLIIVIFFAVIAFITAWIVRFIRCICRRFLGDCCSNCPRRNSRRRNDSDNDDEGSSNDENNSNGNLLTISCRCNNGNTQDILSINSNCLGAENDDDNDSTCSQISTASAMDTTGVALAQSVTSNQMGRARGAWNRNYYRRF